MPCLVFRKRFTLFGDEVFLGENIWPAVLHTSLSFAFTSLGHSLFTHSRLYTVCSSGATVLREHWALSQGRRGCGVLFYLPGGEDVTGREFLEAGELGSVVCVWMRNSGGTRARWQKGGKGRDLRAPTWSCLEVTV